MTKALIPESGEPGNSRYHGGLPNSQQKKALASAHVLRCNWHEITLCPKRVNPIPKNDNISVKITGGKTL
jgi:hypothetical protein